MLSLRRKERVVHAALALLTIWPAVHLGLVARYDVSPWKLAGWGMYSTPRFGLIGMEIYGRAGTATEWQQLTAPAPELRSVAAEFLERHRWLRGLASAHDVLDLVRSQHPEWDEIHLTVSYPELERSTGMVVLTRDERFDRKPR